MSEGLKASQPTISIVGDAEERLCELIPQFFRMYSLFIINTLAIGN